MGSPGLSVEKAVTRDGTLARGGVSRIVAQPAARAATVASQVSLRIQHLHILRAQPLVQRLNQRIVQGDAPVVAELHLHARAAVAVAHRDGTWAVPVRLEQTFQGRRGSGTRLRGFPIHRQANPPREPAAGAGDVVDPVGGDAHEYGLALLAHGAAHVPHFGFDHDDRVLLDSIADLVEHLIVYSDLMRRGTIRELEDHHAAALSPLNPYRFHHPGDQLRARPALALRRGREAAQVRPDETPDLGAVHGEGVPREIEPQARFLLAQALRLFPQRRDRKSTRLNSSHVEISYAVFCLKKKKKKKNSRQQLKKKKPK